MAASIIFLSEGTRRVLPVEILLDRNVAPVSEMCIVSSISNLRRCKSNQLNIQKQRLAENIHNSTNFWREIKKINPANKLSTTIMDNANGDKEITSLLVNKYETLYSSVPTDDNEMNQLHLIIRELLGRLEKASKDYGMEISGEKTKIMTNNINGMTTALHIAGNTLDEVQSFKYLGAIISEEGSKPEVLARIAQATAALSSLKKIWRDRNITLRSKIRLLRSLVISIFLYACESWTLTADLQRRIQAMEMRCYRRLLNISYTEHITNVEVRSRIERAIGPYEDLLTTVKRRKLKWYGHVSRSSGLSKTIMQGTVKGGRRRGGQRKRWEDNIKDWTCLRTAESLRVSKDRNGWREVVRRSVMAPLRPPEVMG